MDSEDKNTTTSTTDAPPAPAAPTRAFKGRYNSCNDPNTAPARIYIGNLSEKAAEEDLRTKFSKYGQIVGKKAIKVETMTK